MHACTSGPLTGRHWSVSSLTAIRRGVFKSVAELDAAIETWLTERNAKPKPFKWTANANIILEKNARGRRALEEDLAAGTK